MKVMIIGNFVVLLSFLFMGPVPQFSALGRLSTVFIEKDLIIISDDLISFDNNVCISSGSNGLMFCRTRAAKNCLNFSPSRTN